MKRTWRSNLIRLLLVLVLAGGAWGWWHVRSGAWYGRRLLASRDYAAARTRLARYLWLHPRDHQARLLLAQAWATDPAQPAVDAAVQAGRVLDQIPDHAPEGPEARLRQARLTLVVLHRPAEAERLVLRCLARNERSFDGWMLLWRIRESTERYHECHEPFRRAFELTPETDRVLRLREWYLTEFSPASANMELDRELGVLAADQIPGDTTTVARLDLFVQNEPEAPMHYAALARFWLRLHNRDEALAVLQAGMKQAADPLGDPFFLATRISLDLELGEVDALQELLARWPEPRDGYEYWKLRGMIAEELDRDYAAAADAYERAVKIWPGDSDWFVMTRHANCLARLGRHDDAAALRARALQVQSQMAPELHGRLRRLLSDLSNPRSLREFEQFLRTLRRNEQADWLKQYADALDTVRR